MDTNTIRNTIQTIRTDAAKATYKSLKIKYFAFYEQYPKLFDVATDTRFNLTYLEPMLAELDKLNNKTVDMDTADKTIYGQLRSVYVDPLINISDEITSTQEVGVDVVEEVEEANVVEVEVANVVDA